MQEKTMELVATLTQVSLQIYNEKTKLLKINTGSKETVKLGSTALKEVEAFTYLGIIINSQGGTDADVKARTAFL